MASPQLENGYCKIANPIMEALAKIRISGEARQVLDAIIRKTYGWNKKEDKITVPQFVEMTGLSDVHVCQGLRKLRDMNIIVVTDIGNKCRKYRLNKDFEQWEKLLPKMVTSELLPKLVTVVTEIRNPVTEISNKCLPGALPDNDLQPPKDTCQKTLQKTLIAIFEKWNSKKIVVHRRLTDKIKRKISGALKDGFTEKEILEAIDNYAEVYFGNQYFWSYKWCLEDFIAKGLKKFTTDMEPQKNHLKAQNKKEDEQLEALFGAR